MFCFWTGEVKLGSIPEVVFTEAGFLDGREVVKVFYDPDLAYPSQIINKAAEIKCADAAYLEELIAGKFDIDVLPYKASDYIKAPTSDQKKQIQGTKFQSLDLTDYQKTKINSYARSDFQKALEYLSPRQRQQL